MGYWPEAERECAHCKRPFVRTHNRQVHCSIDCRFLYRVDVRGEDECWPWIGGKTTAGYGILNTRQKHQTYAHRFACERAHGPAPSARHYACHSCDNPGCCNPKHLRWALPTDNVNDMYARGRQGERNYARGDRHGMRRKKLEREAQRGCV